jgi:hypothetical protein
MAHYYPQYFVWLCLVINYICLLQNLWNFLDSQLLYQLLQIIIAKTQQINCQFATPHLVPPSKTHCNCMFTLPTPMLYKHTNVGNLYPPSHKHHTSSKSTMCPLHVVLTRRDKGCEQGSNSGGEAHRCHVNWDHNEMFTFIKPSMLHKSSLCIKKFIWCKVGLR